MSTDIVIIRAPVRKVLKITHRDKGTNEKYYSISSELIKVQGIKIESFGFRMNYIQMPLIMACILRNVRANMTLVQTFIFSMATDMGFKKVNPESLERAMGAKIVTIIGRWNLPADHAHMSS